MKRSELIFNIVSIVVDSAMLFFAASAAYFLRYRTVNSFPQYPIQFDLSYPSFLRNFLVALPIVLAFLAINGLYNLKSTRRFWPMIIRVAAVVSAGLMVFVAAYFFDPQIFPSRLIVLLTWVLSILLVGLGRTVLLLTERTLLRRGIGQHKLVLIRGAKGDYGLEAQIKKQTRLGYKIIAILDGRDDAALVHNLERIDNTDGIDEILQADVDLTPSANEDLVRFTHDHGILFQYVPDIIESQRTNITATDVAGIPIIELRNTPLQGWGKVVKRVMDITLSFLGLLLLSPLIVLIAIAIRIDSPGRVLYVQQRFGQGRPFKFYKFRSMFQELSVGEEYGGSKAENMRQELWKVNARHGPFLKVRNDPRVTRLGRVLRATKLDELPQLLNVLRGEMSLVGPRAHVIEEVELYREKYRRQFTIKPGLTGLTQIAQAREPDLPFEEEIRLNTFYIENWSFALDLKIILNTLLVLFSRAEKKAYY